MARQKGRVLSGIRVIMKKRKMKEKGGEIQARQRNQLTGIHRGNVRSVASV
jgi:hypothetical protein